MGTIHRIKDNLVNFVTGLGTMKDPTTGLEYKLDLMNRNIQETAYRSDWLARRIVDAPAEDATREWRSWQASNKQIEAIENTEKKFDLQKKMRQALIRARLYGGAALVLGVEQGESLEELDIEKVGKDDLKFVVVLSCHELSAGPRIYNVMSPYYSRPEYYTVATPMHGFDYDETLQAAGAGMIKIHPSRVIEFYGSELPDWGLSPMGGGWGDSVLQICDETLKDFGLTVGSIATMVSDAKMDVVKIPDFSKNIATKDYAERLLKRFTFANTSKSTINSLLLDREEEWERVQTSFASLPQLLNEFMSIVAGAGGIPVSRLMGQAPSKGLGSGASGGEQDMRNYYDTIAAQQRTIYTPALEPLDQVLIRSTFGTYDPNIYYEWNSLYLPDPKEIASIAVLKAQVMQADVTMGLINPDVLRRVRINQTIEDATYPGMEDAVDEFGEEPEEPEIDPNFTPGQVDDPKTGKPAEEKPKEVEQKLRIVHSVDSRDRPFVDDDSKWDELKHPREPAGSPDSTGGEFAEANLIGNRGDPKTISSRLITAKGRGDKSAAKFDELRKTYHRADLDGMREDTANFDHNIGLFGNEETYPMFRDPSLEGVIDTMANNIRALWDDTPPEEREQWKKWYAGAYNRVTSAMEKYGYDRPSTTAVFAALSPQKVWDMNAYLADRVLDIHRNQQNTPWTDDMAKKAKELWLNPKQLKVLETVKNKSLGALDDPLQKAMWIRTYDETYSNRHYPLVNIDGSDGPLATIDRTSKVKRDAGGKIIKEPDGKSIRETTQEPAKATWQNLLAIASAVASLESKGNRDRISRVLSENHKVRSFYNNILDPTSKNGDITIDTHAAGGALLSPFGGTTTQILQLFGRTPDADNRKADFVPTRSSALVGSQGLYPVYAEAYRKVAAEVGIEYPMQLQSVIWERKIKLFGEPSPKQDATINALWRTYRAGKASLDETQKAIIALAKRNNNL